MQHLLLLFLFSLIKDILFTTIYPVRDRVHYSFFFPLILSYFMCKVPFMIVWLCPRAQINIYQQFFISLHKLAVVNVALGLYKINMRHKRVDQRYIMDNFVLLYFYFYFYYHSSDIHNIYILKGICFSI